MSDRAARRGLLLLLALYLVAGTALSVVAPLGESPDEMEQFWYMRWIVEEGRLPRTPAERLAAGGKSHEPPLYYALLGLATSWVDTESVPRIRILDPDRVPRHAIPDETLINLALLHTADEEWPYRGVILAWHLARLGSLALMAGALAVVFSVGRRVCPAHPGLALLATTGVALTPQFLYIGASLNNDALTALLGATLAWLLLGLAQDGPRLSRLLLVGVVLGLARLVKFYTLALVPAVALVLLLLSWRERDRRYSLGLLPVLILALAIPAPWALSVQPVDASLTSGAGRALALLDVVHVERWFTAGGEGLAGTGPLAVARALLDVARLEPLAWAWTLFRSFWGYFGPMTLPAPGGIYLAAGGLTLAALAGWVRLAATRERSLLGQVRDTWIPAVFLLAMLGTEAVFFGVMKRLPDTAQARHLYPALAGIALAYGLGWWGLAGALRRPWAPAALAALLLGMGSWCLPTIWRSVERPFIPVRSTPWPDAPSPSAPLPLGDGLVLEGVRLEPGAGEVRADLFWTAEAAPTGDLVAVLELVDGEGRVRAVWAGHPGGRRYPTRAWSAGDHVRQQLRWPLPASCTAGEYTVALRVLREGAPLGQAGLGQVRLSADGGPQAEGSRLQVSGQNDTTARLRDTVLVTAGGAGQAPTGPEPWGALARTWDGAQAAYVVDERVAPGDYAFVAGRDTLLLTVEGRARLFSPPDGLTPLGVSYAGGPTLVGYELPDSDVAPGEALHLRLVWQASERSTTHYTVFVHLVDSQGILRGQHDKLPGQDYSTLFWAPGEVVVDEYVVPIDPATPAGPCTVRVGLYQALTGARAAAASAAGEPLGDAATLAEVRIGVR